MIRPSLALALLLISCGPAIRPSTGGRVRAHETITYQGSAIGMVYYPGSTPKDRAELRDTTTRHLKQAHGWLKPYGMAFPAGHSLRFHSTFSSLDAARRAITSGGGAVRFHSSPTQGFFYDPGANVLHIQVDRLNTTTGMDQLSLAEAHYHLRDWSHPPAFSVWEQEAMTLDIQIESSR